MSARLDRVVRMVESLAAGLRGEATSVQAVLTSLRDSLRALQEDTDDRRLLAVSSGLREAEEKLRRLLAAAESDLSILRLGLDDLSAERAQARSAPLLQALLALEPADVTQAAEALLDWLLVAVGGERGFVVFYSPESTEAEVVGARHFETRNLSLQEYTLSRTILRRVLEDPRPAIVDDAAGHPEYGAVASVQALQLRSVIAVPLTQDGRTLGALYLEDGRRAGAFVEEDLALLQTAARAAISCLRRARLVPAPPGGDAHVFLDERRASRELVGRDPRLRAALAVVRKVADSAATVLIHGESGTGKELLARALHFEGVRRDRPFVAINCAAIPQDLLESELFGHEKGAFTGAGERRAGRLEEGDGGTVFLDEISELPYAQQPKLLRFLQSGELQRVGGHGSARVDVRVVAATSKDLRALVAAGRFQEALYYRLEVIPVVVPPLRERRGDARALAEHFFRRYGEVYGRSPRVEPGVFEALEAYDFPGNVRELENLVHRLVALAPDDWIRVGDLPALVRSRPATISLAGDPPADLRAVDVSTPDELRQRKAAFLKWLSEQEARLAEKVLRESGGRVEEAARRLGIHRATLHRLLSRSRESGGRQRRSR